MHGKLNNHLIVQFHLKKSSFGFFRFCDFTISMFRISYPVSDTAGQEPHSVGPGACGGWQSDPNYYPKKQLRVIIGEETPFIFIHSNLISQRALQSHHSSKKNRLVARRLGVFWFQKLAVTGPNRASTPWSLRPEPRFGWDFSHFSEWSGMQQV